VAFVGDPGIGKTALLDAAARAAVGFTVLRASGALSESDFPYAGLLALLRPLAPQLTALPPAQCDALEAVLRADVGQVEGFVVGAGTLAVAAAAAELQPLLVLVDDVQWLDEPTRDVLGFVVRRLAADNVAVVLAARPDGLGDLGRVVELVVEIAPLDDLSAAAVLAEVLVEIDPAAREVVLAAAHGNPLALLELPRRLTDGQRRGLEPLPPTLVAGGLVEQAFAASASALPERVRLALATASLLDEGAIGELVAATAELGVSIADLEPAEAQGLVTLASGRVAFRHPLVRAAVLQAIGDAGRRSVHRALAAVLPPGERRALHRAEAAVGPDEGAGRELIDAATTVPPITAAALLARAAELRVADADRALTLSAASSAALAAGRLDQADSLAHRAATLDPPPAVRGAALVVRGRIAWVARSAREACELLLDGAELLESSDRPAAASAIRDAFLASLPGGAPAVTVRLGERFLGVVDRTTAPARASATLAEGICLIQSGKGKEGETVLRGLLDGEAIAATTAREAYLIAALWLADHRRALNESELAIAEARASGHVVGLPRLLLFAGFSQARLGRFSAAYAGVSEAVDMAEELGQAAIWCDCANTLAGLEARLGLHGRCREHAEQAIERSTSLGLDWYASHATINLALSELAQGRAARVVELLEPLHAHSRAAGIVDPGEYGYHELIEAYILLGRLEEATGCLAELERLLLSVPRRSEQLHAVRCAALLADGEKAQSLFVEALALDTGEMPFEVAYTHLLFGEWLRRTGERRRARGQLTAALDIFERLGSEWWAERCRRELAASGARLRRLDPATRDELTPQELQVALQVARGLSNREIAQTLFLSPKTVEFHLTRIYRKLDLHARTELVERFCEQVERP